MASAELTRRGTGSPGARSAVRVRGASALRRALVGSALASGALAGSAVLGSASGCGDPPVLALEISTGQEEGALALDPAVAIVEIAARSPEGEVQLLTSAAPGEEFELGEAPDTTILSFELTGKTSGGEIVARGRSISIPVGALEAGVLPLFIQRLGSFARPPGGLVRAHVHAPAGVLGQQFLIATGGDSAVGDDGEVNPALGDYYDLLLLAGYESPALPRAARSLVVRGSQLFLIDDDGMSIVDLQGAATSDPDPPEGFEFSEVSGGLAIDTPDEIGITYVVGGTRPEEPSDAVFVFQPDGDFSALRLAAKRAGAAAVYVDEVGLVIVGGSSEGPGVEVVQDDGSTVLSIPFPADPTTGAAAVRKPAQLINLFGGRSAVGAAASRELDLRCTGDCEGKIRLLESVPVPEITARGRAFETARGTIVIGENDEGETLAFLVSQADESVEPLPLREPRRGATAVGAPNGTLAVIGGLTLTGAAAASVELLFPE